MAADTVPATRNCRSVISMPRVQKLRVHRSSAALIAAVLAASAAAAHAHGHAPGEPGAPASITVTAQTTIEAVPDLVRIDLGVTTQAKDAEAAARENAQRSQAVLKALRASLGAAADIRTLGYALGPAYEYPREGGQPKLVGFRASNIVRVTTSELAKAGAIIDAATRAGGNEIQHIEFTLKDPGPARADVLRKAAALARTQADALAAALGQRIVRVLSAVEGGQVQPFADVRMANMRESAATPIEPGTISIPATLTLTVEIQPR
jgi:uncharacterized protein